LKGKKKRTCYLPEKEKVHPKRKETFIAKKTVLYNAQSNGGYRGKKKYPSSTRGDQKTTTEGRKSTRFSGTDSFARPFLVREKEKEGPLQQGERRERRYEEHSQEAPPIPISTLQMRRKKSKRDDVMFSCMRRAGTSVFGGRKGNFDYRLRLVCSTAQTKKR